MRSLQTTVNMAVGMSDLVFVLINFFNHAFWLNTKFRKSRSMLHVTKREKKENRKYAKTVHACTVLRL